MRSQVSYRARASETEAQRFDEVMDGSEVLLEEEIGFADGLGCVWLAPAIGLTRPWTGVSVRSAEGTHELVSRCSLRLCQKDIVPRLPVEVIAPLNS